MTDSTPSPGGFDEAAFEAELRDPKNVGEMSDADAVGTVGSPDCGDMLRLWLKFTEREDGQKVIDRASFQSFGCQTAIAVASLATELLKGKTTAEAAALEASQLSGDLGALPPMKVHCGQLVEEALKQALSQAGAAGVAPETAATSPGLASALVAPQATGLKIVFD